MRRSRPNGRELTQDGRSSVNPLPRAARIDADLAAAAVGEASSSSADGAKGAYTLGRVRQRDEAFADEHGVETGVGERRRVGGSSHARLGDTDHGRRHRPADAPSPVVVNGERTQIALVDPHKRCSYGKGSGQFFLIVDFDERIEADARRRLMEPEELVVVKGGGDQQHAVRAHQPGVVHVDLPDGEVLADHRESRRSPRDLEVLDGATEVVDVGEHREARRATVSIRGGQDGGVEIRRKWSLRRRAPLDLGNHTQPRGTQRSSEAPGRRRNGDRRLPHGGEVTPVGRHTFPVGVHDPFEIGASKPAHDTDRTARHPRHGPGSSLGPANTGKTGATWPERASRPTKTLRYRLRWRGRASMFPMATNDHGTIVVVEDDAHIADLLDMSLRQAGYRVIQATTGEAGLAAIDRERPRAVILDVGLPGDLDGLDVCMRLRAKSTVPVLFLTARDSEVDRILGLELGADDYITKPFSPRELVARIKAILRRLDATSTKEERPENITIGEIEVDIARREVRVGTSAVSLATREFDLLAFFASNQGLVLSRQQLLDGVWGAGWFGDERTVDVHVRQLRKKLGDGFELKTVFGVGYRLN